MYFPGGFFIFRNAWAVDMWEGAPGLGSLGFAGPVISTSSADGENLRG